MANQEPDFSQNYKEKLAELITMDKERFDKIHSNPNYSFKHSAYNHWFTFENKAWGSFLLDGDVIQAKKYFNACATIDCERIEQFNTNIFSFGRTHVSYAALSDNKELIKRYAELNPIREYTSRGKDYKETHFDRVAKGDDEIYCDTMIRAMTQDMDGLAKNIKTLESITLKKKSRSWMEPDYQFFLGVLKKDKDLILEIIEKLSSKRIHNQRNKHNPLAKNYVTEPGIGFAKIAWINGIEIEPSSELIPKELLPVQPPTEFPDYVTPLLSRVEVSDGRMSEVSASDSETAPSNSKSWWQIWKKN